MLRKVWISVKQLNYVQIKPVLFFSINELSSQHMTNIIFAIKSRDVQWSDNICDRQLPVGI